MFESLKKLTGWLSGRDTRIIQLSESEAMARGRMVVCFVVITNGAIFHPLFNYLGFYKYDSSLKELLSVSLASLLILCLSINMLPELEKVLGPEFPWEHLAEDEDVIRGACINKDTKRMYYNLSGLKERNKDRYQYMLMNIIVFAKHCLGHDNYEMMLFITKETECNEVLKEVFRFVMKAETKKGYKEEFLKCLMANKAAKPKLTQVAEYCLHKLEADNGLKELTL